VSKYEKSVVGVRINTALSGPCRPSWTLGEAEQVAANDCSPLAMPTSGEFESCAESRPSRRPVPAAGPVYWDGTLPGAMAGKRPAARTVVLPLALCSN